MADSDTQAQNNQSNCITFNGTVITAPIEVGENIVAISIESPKKEELPLIIIESTMEVAEKNLKIGTKLSAFGYLAKIDGDWVIMCQQLSIL